MPVHKINPLQDARWSRLVERHPRASVFHTPGWLEALRRTYGYEPVVYTTAAPGEELRDGLVFCRIESWLTGRRMVSLPFSDHCQPLAETPAELKLLLAAFEQDSDRAKWRYIELRPMDGLGEEFEKAASLAASETYCFHQLDLRPDIDRLFGGFHKNHIQRKIQRAEREGLTYEEGRSASLLSKFYELLVLTRRRHQLPPQPMAWFRNVLDCLGDQATIRLVSKDAQPVASIMTLFYKKTLTYKYGSSDARFNNLGGTPFLFWQTIQEGKARGAETFDLGRSDVDNAGLIAFKDHWGAVSSCLKYYRHPPRPGNSTSPGTSWKMTVVKSACARMPTPLFTAVGRILYKHVG